MKKVSLLAFLLATVGVTTASAETLVPGCPKAFQGFGLRGILGYDVGFGKRKDRFNRRDFLNATTLNTERSATSADTGFRGIDGGIGVDYTHRLCNWAIGIGFDATWANTSGKLRHRDSNRDARFPTLPVVTRLHAFHGKVHLRNSLQLFARAGYVIGGQVMPFVGLGWDNSQWKQSLSGVAPGVVLANDTLSANRRFRTHKSKRLNALLWKLGVDFLLTKHTILGFEYTGTAGGRLKSHRTVTIPQNAGAAIGGATIAARSSFRPQNNRIALTFKIIY